MTMRDHVIAIALWMALADCIAPGWAAAQAPAAPSASAPQVSGMVVSTDTGRRTLLVSHDAIEGGMGAMTMAFVVRDAATLAGLTPGSLVRFTLVMEAGVAYADGLVVVPYESTELDPMNARRLRQLEALAGTPRPAPLAVGATVPDFTLTDHTGSAVTLSALRGRVVVVNFIYTSCALTQFCFRVANHFASLAERFGSRMGSDVVLLTITFDPARDTVEVLRDYARQWRVDAATWRFLTGTPDDVRRVCDLFGVDAFPDEGLMNHSLRTAVIDRRGTLVARIEGNEYTAAQLGDLVTDVVGRR